MMLVITRRIDETILIGDDIKITVIKTVNGKAKIGIEAPKDFKIIKQEVAIDSIEANHDA